MEANTAAHALRLPALSIGVDSSRSYDANDLSDLRQARIEGTLPDKNAADLVEINLGEKIVLYRHECGIVAWWSRLYDSDSLAAIGRGGCEQSSFRYGLFPWG